MKYIILILLIILNVGCKENSDLYWIMINVNSTGKQGDAHLIIKGNKTFMIDTGQAYYVANTLLPYLKKRNITHLNGVLITHPHFDHYGGMRTLIENNIKIDSIYMNMPTEQQMKKEWWGGIILI